MKMTRGKNDLLQTASRNLDMADLRADLIMVLVV